MNGVWVTVVVVFLSGDLAVPKAPQFLPTKAACQSQLNVSREFVKSGVGQTLADKHGLAVEGALFACATVEQFLDEEHMTKVLADESLHEPMSYHPSESSI